jgi:hypothetical protein
MAGQAVAHGTELRLDTAINGLAFAIPAGTTSLLMGGTPTPVTDVLAKAQDLVKSWKELRDAHAVIRAFTQNRAAENAAARNFLADLRAALVTVLGRDNQDLTKFGFKPQTPRAPLTTEQKLLRAAKAKLTREARHTMGKRQKASIRATETPVVQVGPDGVLIAPPAAPAKPSNGTTPSRVGP